MSDPPASARQHARLHIGREVPPPPGDVVGKTRAVPCLFEAPRTHPIGDAYWAPTDRSSIACVTTLKQKVAFAASMRAECRRWFTEHKKRPSLSIGVSQEMVMRLHALDACRGSTLMTRWRVRVETMAHQSSQGAAPRIDTIGLGELDFGRESVPPAALSAAEPRGPTMQRRATGAAREMADHR